MGQSLTGLMISLISRLPSQKRASDQQQEEKNSGGGRGLTNFQFKVLPADSPSPQLHKTGLEKNRDRGVERWANEKEPTNKQ